MKRVEKTILLIRHGREKKWRRRRLEEDDEKK